MSMRPHSSSGKQQTRTIIYTRVSTDDQAKHGNSLRDQEERLLDYCQRTGREVQGHYQDDHSAKTFDRPQFQLLLKYLEANRGIVDELLVQRWDRFSRDITEAFVMVGRLRELGVEVQSSEQSIDPSVPESIIQAAIYFAAPHVENLRRSENAKKGMRRAMLEGRWCNTPPFGYKRRINDRQQATIEPSDDAPLILEAFKIAATSMDSIEAIRKKMTRRGLACSRSRFPLLLQNKVYKGVIYIPAWKRDLETEVLGDFNPIVSEGLFEKVQSVRFGKRKAPRAKCFAARQDLFLRGHLACPICSSGSPELVTGSLSRGKSGRRYAYYHCHRCGNYRIPAEMAHEAVDQFIRTLEIAPDVAVLYKEIEADVKAKSSSVLKGERLELEQKMKMVNERLFGAAEALIEKRIDLESHARVKERYDREAISIRSRLSEIKSLYNNTATRLGPAVDLLQRISSIWQTTMDANDPELVSDFLSSIVPEKMVVEDGDVRTPFGSLTKDLFGPERHKIEDASSYSEPASSWACPERFELSTS